MKMKHAIMKCTLPVVLLATVFTGCEKDKSVVNEGELITTVQLRFTEVGTANVSTFTFRDTDGEGGNAPSQFQDITLAPNKQYNLAIMLLDESKTPAVNITNEVKEEDKDHQFYYQPSGVNITVSNLDADSNGLPLGITSTWSTGAASNGKVKITLKHKPGIKANGDAVTKGDTDVELDWTAKVQ